ncbi:MAG: DUF6265 family protein [Stenotrophobium sp.]
MRLLILMMGLAASGIASAADAPRATAFAWMSGCWGYESGGSRYTEHWLPATGNALLGVDSRVAGGYTRDYDYKRIVTSGDGFDLIILPKDGAEHRLGMTSLQGSKAQFESLDDPSVFPFRVSYEYTAPDALSEHLEGKVGGQPVSTVFPMKRISCTGP